MQDQNIETCKVRVVLREQLPWGIEPGVELRGITWHSRESEAWLAYASSQSGSKSHRGPCLDAVRSPPGSQPALDARRTRHYGLKSDPP